MKTTVDGISITLTDDQVKYIQEVKTDRRKACNSFTRTLKYFGFKKIKGTKNSYENKEKLWYAEVYNDQVLLGGKNLPRASYPPGLVTHWSVDSIIKELEGKI